MDSHTECDCPLHDCGIPPRREKIMVEFPPPLPSRIAVPNAAGAWYLRRLQTRPHNPIWIHGVFLNIIESKGGILGSMLLHNSLYGKFGAMLLIAILSSCHPDPFPHVKCPAMNNRKMPLVGIDKCGCLYGVPACSGAPDCMYTTDRKPCL